MDRDYTVSPVSTHSGEWTRDNSKKATPDQHSLNHEGVPTDSPAAESEPKRTSGYKPSYRSPPARGYDEDRVRTEPTKGLWRYSPFQYLSLKPKIASPYFTTMIACMGGLLFGFGSTNLTPFIGKSDYEKYFGQFSVIDQSGMTACIPGGAFLGSLLSSAISEHMGRRGMMQISSLLWTIGAAIQTSCINRESLAFGRIIAGMGVGAASSNVPMYLSEMVPAETRGRFTACFQFSVNVGILVMFYIGWGCHFIHGVKGFRLAWGIQMVPGALMFLGSMFLHESPRWLASKGRWTEVVEVLTVIRHADPESERIQDEVHEFQAEIEVEPASFLDLFRRRNIKQTSCAFVCMLTQQYCGCNAILYFSTSITSQVGYHGVMNDFMGSVDYICLLAATLPALIFFDRWSRRHNLMAGALAMLTCLAIVAGLEGARGEPVGPEGLNGDPSVRWNVPAKKPALAALAFSYIFCGMFSLSWGPAAWVYVGEIFNQDTRSVGNAFASAVNWLFNFTLTIYTSKAFENIVWKTYVIFAVFCAISIPLVFFLFPETRGYELEQITKIFESNIPAYKTDPIYKWAMKLFGKEVNLPIAETTEDVTAAEKKGRTVGGGEADHREVISIE